MGHLVSFRKEVRRKVSETMATYSKYKKGDLVIVDDDGSALEVEIVSTISARGGGFNSRVQGGDEKLYDVKDVNTGEKRTVSEDEILRLATPVDNSAELFSNSGSVPTKKK